MALSSADLQSIMLLLNEGLGPITKEMQAMKAEMKGLATKEELKGLASKGDLKDLATKEELKKLATKEELKGLASKEDLRDLATKEELKNLATKEELKGLASKEDLKDLATKEELKNLATKEELKGLATKEDVEIVFKELLKTEAGIGRIESRVDELTDKVDTLLLQSDNTALLLKLMNQQADEVNNIRSRVEVLEMKLA